MSCKPCKSPARQIIHETNPRRQHRLVILKGGIPVSSPWYESHEGGMFQGLHFYLGEACGLPSVFRAVAIDHEVLG
jgi:hypothetical protein